MTNNNLYFFVLLMLLNAQLFSQSPCGTEEHSTPRIAEELSYLVTYKWGLIWADAGEVTFLVHDTTINDTPAYRFHGFGRSLKRWDWFFKVRSTYESVTDYELHPYTFTRAGQEGSNNYFNEYIFHQDTASFRRVDRKGDLFEKSIGIDPCTFDVISAIYYCRSLDYANTKEDEILPLNMLMGGELHRSYIKYKGKTEIWHPKLKRKIECFHFKPMLMAGSVFKQGENMNVYVTADDKKIPVFIETGLRVGSAKIWLTNTNILE